MGTTEDQLRREAQVQRDRMGDTLDAIGDRLSPERMIERRKAAVGQRWQNVKTTVMGSPEYREPVTERMRGAMETASDTMQRAPQMVADQARGNPIAAGIIAFGVGALLASVMPKSAAEQRLVDDVKPQLQGAAEELKGIGRDVAAGAKEQARSAMDEVKSAGTEAGARVKEQAQESAGAVRSAAQGQDPPSEHEAWRQK